MLRSTVLGSFFLTSSALLAGGLTIFIGNPSASPDPAAAGAVLLVQVQGCGNAMEAQVRAVARPSGDSNRLVRMEVVHLAKPETVVLRGDEVKRGDWTVVVTANHLGYQWSAIVPLKDGVFDRKTIRQERRRLSESTD